MIKSINRRTRRFATNPQEFITDVGNRIGTWLSSRGHLGTNVFDKEWDLLILLDTCRVDALRAVAPEYDFLGDVGAITSCGSSSAEWITATFQRRSPDELRDTAYLSCNGYAQFVLEAQGGVRDYKASAPANYFFDWGDWEFPHESELGLVEHVWQYEPTGDDDAYGHPGAYTGPRFVTDRGVSVGREHDFDRMILHYSQPHRPYAARALAEDRPLYDYEREPFEALRSGVDRETVLGAYLDDLRYVLDDVELLLDNIDAERVAISADHGEAFGEWGVYEHPIGSLLPQVRRVPWVETVANDRGGYEPTVTPDDAGDPDVDEQLQALGYK
jgi:hypothetical protein